MKPKVALLSNCNLNYLIRKLRNSFEIYEPEGYGNELGLLMDRQSSYHAFQPQFTFLIMDLSELVGHAVNEAEALPILENWFSGLESSLLPGVVYYLSDAYFWNPEHRVLPYDLTGKKIEALYDRLLNELYDRHENVRIFPFSDMIREIGEERTFQPKTWYLGKILYHNEFQTRLVSCVEKIVEMERRVPKKVLVLDLDNTLWGGLAGEHDHQEIVLSEDHAGLAYKNGQRAILRMKEAGVILAIVSKNNEADAWNLIEDHPHMMLRKKDFAATRINWAPKDQNIREIAKELQLGLDSFVFWDDQPAERELVRQVLPEVTVPDFPASPEELAPSLADIYDLYFRKGRITSEDRSKTESYEQNRMREELRGNSQDYSEYLKSLKIVIKRVDPRRHFERLVQLVNKTNQFNLTTRRFQPYEMEAILSDPDQKVFLYRIEDRFGDYGVTAAVIVDQSDIPVITEWVLSCRVMGKRVEAAILEDVEREIRLQGKSVLRGRYNPTAKNHPVEKLYDQMGYHLVEEGEAGDKLYEIQLETALKHEYYALLENETLD